ncbi:MAG: polysaccharide deacetylase family protein [Myxococcales bacterium]|nr:polysaccharide deacetylase family protein [Myxococcales bacterium]MDH3484584.1 polysaccharide deacetylase family protein [Myxococcales bacterium]
MPMVPWRVRLSCFVLVLVAGGSLAGAARPRSAPVVEPIQVAAHVSRTLEDPSPIDPSFALEVAHGLEPGPPPHDVTGERYPSGLTIDGSTKRRTILFSFDDGPSRRTTPALLDLLDQLDLRAVFFVKTESFGRGNPWEREHREIVREIVSRGHMIGNHTETHRQLPLLNNAEIDAELAVSEAKIENAIGLRPRLIRPPGGALSTRVRELLAARGYTSVLWSVYTGDLEVDTADDVVRTFFRVLRRRERETGDRGGIILLHDTQLHSLEAVPRLVDALRRRNCELLERNEELYDIVDDVGYFIPGYEPASLDDRQADLEARTRRDCAALALR